MSKINETNSYNNDGKSSKLIIISKSRLSSAKDNPNFITFYDRDNKITCDIGKEKIQKKKLKEVFSTLKEKLLKYSSSTGKLDISIQKLNKIPKRNKLSFSKNNGIENNHQNKGLLNTIETCNELINNENNKEIKIIDKNKRGNFSKEIKKRELVESNYNNKSESNNREEDSLDFNLEGLKIINIEKLNNNKNIKQNKNLLEDYYHIYKSEEIQRNSKQSDKAVKSINEIKSNNNIMIKVLDSERSENKKHINNFHFLPFSYQI